MNRILPHWEYYDELLELWKATNYLKYRRFNRVAVSAGFPDVDYSVMVGRFERETGIKAIGTISEAKKNRLIWDNYAELYALWLLNKRCKCGKFTGIAAANGFHRGNYISIVKSFVRKYNEN